MQDAETGWESGWQPGEVCNGMCGGHKVMTPTTCV
jgi:hypothetical protein